MTSTIQPPSSQAQQQAASGPGLPPTGLQQQLNSMRQGYQAYRQARVPGLGGVGVDVNAGAAGNQQSLRGPLQARQQGGGTAAATNEAPMTPTGQTSLQALAQRLASSYGLAVGRDQLVDSAGNFNFTPDQLSSASGGSETMGTAAAKMNYIASAIQRQQTQDAMKKSEAALQAGLGVTSKRARGSMVEQQQGFYQGLANLYQNQDYEAADFSYFIQKEKMDIEQEILRRAEKLQKKKARSGFWTGVALTGIGLATGNYWIAAQGATQAGGSAGETGYF
jgi:hypothetical protein